jgi:hypothetical protein
MVKNGLGRKTKHWRGLQADCGRPWISLDVAKIGL